MVRNKSSNTRSSVLEWLALYSQEEENRDVWVESSVLRSRFANDSSEVPNLVNIQSTTFTKALNAIIGQNNNNLHKKRVWCKIKKRYLYFYNITDNDPNSITTFIKDPIPSASQFGQSDNLNTTRDLSDGSFDTHPTTSSITEASINDCSRTANRNGPSEGNTMSTSEPSDVPFDIQTPISSNHNNATASIVTPLLESTTGINHLLQSFRYATNSPIATNYIVSTRNLNLNFNTIPRPDFRPNSEYDTVELQEDKKLACELTKWQCCLRLAKCEIFKL